MTHHQFEPAPEYGGAAADAWEFVSSKASEAERVLVGGQNRAMSAGRSVIDAGQKAIDDAEEAAKEKAKAAALAAAKSLAIGAVVVLALGGGAWWIFAGRRRRQANPSKAELLDLAAKRAGLPEGEESRGLLGQIGHSLGGDWRRSKEYTKAQFDEYRAVRGAGDLARATGHHAQRAGRAAWESTKGKVTLLPSLFAMFGL